MATVASFPDQSHLDMIRRRLWSVREFGRAAVMVGAGFSRQAIAASPDAAQLPLWDHVGQALAGSLYGADGPAFAQSMSGPRLASEYERTFSRQALESFLLELIPHRSYLVGPSPHAFSFPVDEDTYLHSLLAITHIRWREDEPHHYIDWSRAEAMAIFEKWREWWAAHKPALAGRHPDLAPMAREEVRQMLEVLSQLVLPRIGGAPPDEKAKALALLQDVDAAGASSTPAIPSAIYAGMEPLAAARRLRTELLSASRPTVVDAISGIQYWVYNLSIGGLPAPPAALIDDLVRLVALRRSPGLVSALTVLSDVVKRAPYLLTDDHWQIISTALSFLQRETSLLAPDIGTPMDDVATIELEERPECRRASASLAHAISTMDSQPNQEGLREVVEHWRVAVSVDRLPEVRRTWSD